MEYRIVLTICYRIAHFSLVLGGVIVATRKGKEDEHTVAYRFYINLSLKSHVPSPIQPNSGILAWLKNVNHQGFIAHLNVQTVYPLV